MGKIAEPTASEGKTVDKADLVDVLVSLRDTMLRAVDVIDAYIQTLAPPIVKMEELKAEIPEDLRGRLTFTLEGGNCIITPKGYLGAENFGRIASIVRAHNGTYISNGKNSHFRVPVKT